MFIPNSRFIDISVRLVSSRSRLPPVVVIVLRTVCRLNDFVNRQSTVTLNRKNVESNVLRRKHPSVVLRSSSCWWCVTVATRHSGSENILSVMNTIIRLVEVRKITTLFRVNSLSGKILARLRWVVSVLVLLSDFGMVVVDVVNVAVLLPSPCLLNITSVSLLNIRSVVYTKNAGLLSTTEFTVRCLLQLVC